MERLAAALLFASSAALALSGCNAEPAAQTEMVGTNLPSTLVRITEPRQRISAGWHYLENAAEGPAAASGMDAW